MMQLPMLNAYIRAILLSGTMLLAVSGCASKTQRANEAYAQAQQYLTDGKFAEAKRELLRAVAIRDDVPDIHGLWPRRRIAPWRCQYAPTAGL
jgi:hypothetical protein